MPKQGERTLPVGAAPVQATTSSRSISAAWTTARNRSALGRDVRGELKKVRGGVPSGRAAKPAGTRLTSPQAGRPELRTR
ncbi:hypothetical protein ABZZ20_35300 [Streptomyces sp. NPDC006430]|uniref:hypothetical protein n=1 Tax=Streptomyces sp. NPDC006430 TaxID=3154299 RepID=UPI0033AE106E